MTSHQLFALLLFLPGVLFAQLPAASLKPKLVVGIVVDQFRYDYLLRFRSGFHEGLDRMLREGALFENARYQQVPTVTAVGHSIFMSGAMPSVSGIIANSWWDRASKREVTSVCDSDVELVGATAVPSEPSATNGTPVNCDDDDPASPRRLLVSTLGDELRNMNDASKVFGVSIKPRAAILPSGHRANAAYWFDSRSGSFVTSTYYMHRLPDWLKQWNVKHPADAYLQKPWPGFPQWSFQSEGKQPQYAKLPASPWGNELVESLAEQVIVNERLGTGAQPDLLAVSFSSNDYVGHQVGPDASEVRDMAVRTDALLGKLFQLLDRQVGLKNCLFVLTADHGVSPVPTLNAAKGMPGAYVTINPGEVVRKALKTAFGERNWVEYSSGQAVYLNASALQEQEHPGAREQILKVASEAILRAPELHAVRVYTSEQLSRGVTGDALAAAMTYGYFPRESPDLSILYEPYVVTGKTGTTHFSPYGYDTHVPILFFGFGIRPGRFVREVSVNDIAPTLATMLSIETPSGSSGHVLQELFH